MFERGRFSLLYSKAEITNYQNPHDYLNYEFARNQGQSYRYHDGLADMPLLPSAASIKQTKLCASSDPTGKFIRSPREPVRATGLLGKINCHVQLDFRPAYTYFQRNRLIYFFLKREALRQIFFFRGYIQASQKRKRDSEKFSRKIKCIRALLKLQNGQI